MGPWRGDSMFLVRSMRWEILARAVEVEVAPEELVAVFMQEKLVKELGL